MTRLPHLTVFVLALCLLGLPSLSAASAGAAALGKPGLPAQVSRTVEVEMDDGMRFSPSSIVVARGETIRFRVLNRGTGRHEMVLGQVADLKKHAELMRKFPHMEHDDPNAVAVPPGEMRELLWRFTRAGRFDFACLVPGHYEAGMKGSLEVK
jgi:uncharacterized cupredoxin-like copper-binding protein